VSKEQKTRKVKESLIEKKDVFIKEWREALDEFRSFSNTFDKIEEEYKDAKQKLKELEKKEERLVIKKENQAAKLKGMDRAADRKKYDEKLKIFNAVNEEWLETRDVLRDYSDKFDNTDKEYKDAKQKLKELSKREERLENRKEKTLVKLNNLISLLRNPE